MRHRFSTIRFVPWIIGLLLVAAIGFLVADNWGAESHQGTAMVIDHDYNEAYTTYDTTTKSTTYHSEEFILVIKYEDITTRDEVREHTWKSVADQEKVNITYHYGNFSGSFYVNVNE